MKNVFKKVIAMSLAAVMTAGCMAGCGSSSSSSSTASSESLKKVNFQLKWLPSVQFMGFYVAYEKGYYKDEGIDLNIISGGSDIVSAEQVGIGAADIGVANLYGLLPYEEKEYPIEQIGQVFQKGSLVLVSKASTGVTKPEDLKGKKIGAWLGTADYPIYSLLEKYNIDKDKDVTIASQDYTMDALLNGQIDVASATIYNEYIVLQESGLSKDEINVLNFDDYDCGMLEDALIANTDWSKDNGDTVTAFMKASMKGWSDACADPNAAAEIVWKYVDQDSTTLEHQKASAAQVAKLVAPDGTEASKMLKLDDAVIKETADACLKYKIITKEPSKIYNDTYVTDAAKSLS